MIEPMKNTDPPTGTRRVLKCALFATLIILRLSSPETAWAAETRYTPLDAVPGGLSPAPDILSMGLSNGQMTIDWAGLGAGPFVLERRYTVNSGRWESMGIPRLPTG